MRRTFPREIFHLLTGEGRSVRPDQYRIEQVFCWQSSLYWVEEKICKASAEYGKVKKRLYYDTNPEHIMLNFFFKKERQLETLIYNYLENLGLIQDHFVKAMNVCLKEGVCDDFSFLVDQTHKFESRADDLRDGINELMYSRALIPESRGDIMDLLIMVDKVPRSFEQTLNMIRTQKVAVPEFLILDIQELIRVSMESCDLMAKQIGVMIQKKEGVRALMSTIDQNESHCDHIERRIIVKLFESDLDPFLKLQLKEIVIVLGEISDQADRISKRVNIMTMKRRI